MALVQDSDIFFLLTAADDAGISSSAFRLPHNIEWFRRGQAGVAERPTIESREPTPAPDADTGEDQFQATDHLVITFSHLQQTLAGDELSTKSSRNSVVFGTDPRHCHVLLGRRGTPGISAKQFAVSVHDNLQCFIRDLGSSYGTAVEVNGQNRYETRKHGEPWFVTNDPGKSSKFESIHVWAGRLAIKIFFPNHNKADTTYLQNLKALRDTWQRLEMNGREDASALALLDLRSGFTTQAPSGVVTPLDKPVYYFDKVIGKGFFGEVHRVIRMGDGCYYAAKTFSRPSKKRARDGSEALWLETIRNEFRVVDENPHPNLVKMFGFRDSPEPMIFMEYYSEGNIADAGKLCEATYISAFGQILTGLQHLHSKGIAHRDIKPENFLVKWTPHFTIVISDFGLAKVVPQSAFLKTFCGSLNYTAPEIFPHTSHGHDQLVDIWSLGIIVLKWIYGLLDPPEIPYGGTLSPIQPRFWRQWLKQWCHIVRAKLDGLDDCILLSILYGMLERKPQRRWTASCCLIGGFKGGLFKQRKADNLIISADGGEDASPIELGTKDSARPTSSAASISEGELTIIIKPLVR